MTTRKRIAIAAFGILGTQTGVAVAVDPVVCRRSSGTVKGITLMDLQTIKTKFQFDNPNLPPLLSTPVTVTETGMSSIVARSSSPATRGDCNG